MRLPGGGGGAHPAWRCARSISSSCSAPRRETCPALRVDTRRNLVRGGGGAPSAGCASAWPRPSPARPWARAAPPPRRSGVASTPAAGGRGPSDDGRAARISRCDREDVELTEVVRGVVCSLALYSHEHGPHRACRRGHDGSVMLWGCRVNDMQQHKRPVAELWRRKTLGYCSTRGRSERRGRLQRCWINGYSSPIYIISERESPTSRERRAGHNGPCMLVRTIVATRVLQA